jgi:isopenicillin-N epimerase
MTTALIETSPLARRRRAVWPLETGLTYLNHGSYGSCPAFVLEKQAQLRARLERDPTRFFKVDLEGLCDRAREGIGRFVNAPAEDIALMPNGTVAMAVAMNTVELGPGDEVLVTDHEYAATLNELARICDGTGARVVKAAVTLPVAGPEQVVEAVRGAITNRTRLIVVSHIASASAIIFPAQQLADLANERGIPILLDGAHTPGQIDIDMAALGPAFYAASCHKWVNAPKGTGFLYARPDMQARVRSLAQSCRVHAARERKAFLCDTDYVGTNDYSANLVIPDAIEHMAAQLPGGWPAIMKANHDKIVAAINLVTGRTSATPIAPPEMIGSMASVALPENPSPDRPTIYDDPLQDALNEKHHIQVPVWDIPGVAPRVMRISAQLYNEHAEYQALAEAINEELERE